MKKLLFAVALIGVLIGSTLGGIALAAKPAGVNPIETIEQNTETIIEEVSNITDRLDDGVFGLEEIKNEVVTIETEVLHADWGLKEIKTEVASIEGNVTDSVFGLEAIETEVADIQSQLAAPATGLAKIKAEVENIEEVVTDEVYGLAEIKTEVAGIDENVDDMTGNIAELKAEIASIKSDVDEILFNVSTRLRLECLDAQVISCETGLYQLSGTINVYGLTPVFNVELSIIVDWDEIATVQWDILQPGTTYNWQKIVSYDCPCHGLSPNCWTLSVLFDLQASGRTWGHKTVGSWTHRNIPSHPCSC